MFVVVESMNMNMDILGAVTRVGTKGYTSEFPWLRLGKGYDLMGQHPRASSRSYMSSFAVLLSILSKKSQQSQPPLTDTTKSQQRAPQQHIRLYHRSLPHRSSSARHHVTFDILVFIQHLTLYCLYNI